MVPLACLLLVVGGALYAPAAQDGTLQPGQRTQARVWIQNRGDAEAVPMSIQNMAPEAPPLRVQVVEAPVVTAPSRTGPVEPPTWEYRDVIISADQDPLGVLNAAG